MDGSDITDADLDRAFAVGGTGQVASSQGVSPEHALIGLDGRAVGIPPSVGMHSPEVVQQSVQQQQQQDAIHTSPPVARWAATAEPAHVAVTQDDLPGLADLSMTMGHYLSTGGPFGDIARAFGGAWGMAQTAAQRVGSEGVAAIPNAMKELPAAYLAYQGAPFAAVTEPLARGIFGIAPEGPSRVTGQVQPGTDTLKSRIANAQVGAQALSMFVPLPGVEALLGGRVAEGAGGVRPPPVDVPPSGPPHAGPDGRWATTPEGFVADEQGNPVHFPDQKSAGVWAMREGYASGTDQIFQPANAAGDTGTFHAQVSGTVAPPASDVPQLGVHPGVDAIRGSVAEADAQAIGTIQEQVAATQTHSRSPAVMEAFLTQQVGDRTVGVDPDVLLELAQQGHEPFPEDAQAIADAAAHGEEFELPMARYLARTSGEPFAEELNKATTFRDGGVSVDGAKELGSPAPVEASPPDTVRMYHSGVNAEGTGPRSGWFSTNQEYGSNFNEGEPIWYVDVPADSPLVNNPDIPEQGVKQGFTFNKELPPELVAKAQRLEPDGLTPTETSRAQSLAEATQGAVERAVKAQYLQPLFTEANALGMTKDQFARYSQGVEAAVTDAMERMRAKVGAQILRERKPDWQAALAQHSAQAELELARDPAIAARAYLSLGKGPLGEPIETPFKLDRADQLAQHGIDAGLPDRMFRRNGVSADEAADVFGFPSGANLIKALIDLHTSQGGLTIAQHMKALARGIGEARTREQLGFDITPQAIADAASEAVNGPAVTDFLAQELQVLANEAGLPFDKVALQAYAEARFSSLLVKQALNLRKLEGYVYKLGVKTEKALLKGDFPLAFIRKQQQFIQHLQLAQAHKFAKVYARTERDISRWAKKPISKNVAQNYYNQMRAILESVGVPVRSKGFENAQLALQGVSLDAFHQALRLDGFEPIIFPPIPGKASYTVDQYNGLREMLTSIKNLGMDEWKRTSSEAALARDAMLDTVRANATEVGRRYSAGKLRQQGPIAKGAAIGARTLGAAVARPETYLWWLDGEKVGPLMQTMVDPLQTAKHAEGDLIRKFSSTFKAFAKEQPKEWAKSLREKVNIPELTYSIDADNAPVPWLRTRNDLIMLALNAGSESNLEKLTKGFDWSAEDVATVLARELRPEDAKYVQFLFDQNEELWPMIEREGRRLRGLAPKKIPALPITHQGGTIPGGYWHLDFDKSAVGEHIDAEGNKVIFHDPTALDPESLMGRDYPSSLPPNPHMHARTGFTAPLALDSNLISRAFEQVIHDLTHRGALIDAAKMLKHPAVRQAIADSIGPEYVTETQNWLKYIARGSVYDGKSLSWMSNAIRQFRYNFTNVQIAYNFATLIKHSAIALSHVGGEVGVGDFTQAAADLLRTPGEHEDWMNFILANSGEVRNIMLNTDRDIREAIQQNLLHTGVVDAFKYRGYVLFGWMKKMEAAPTWLAKYRQGIANNLPHEEARFIADKAVRDTQGAGAPVDLAALWRGGDSFFDNVGKLSNMFTGFINTTTNREWTIIRRSDRIGREFKEGDWQGAKRDFNKNLIDSWAFVILPAILATAFEEVTRGKGKHIVSHLAGNLVKSGIGSIPFGETVADIPEMLISKGHDFGSSPVVEAMKAAVNTGRAVGSVLSGHSPDHADKKWILHSLQTVGYMTGQPVGQPAKSLQYIWDYDHSRVGKKSITEFIRGVFFGTKSKDNQ